MGAEAGPAVITEEEAKDVLEAAVRRPDRLDDGTVRAGVADQGKSPTQQ